MYVVHMTTTSARRNGTVECDYCPEKHEAEYHHTTAAQGDIYAVICNDLQDYYTEERVSHV